MKLGIVGATGWLGQALGLRLIELGLWDEAQLVLANRSGTRTPYAAYPKTVWANVAGLCAVSDVIVVAVRPEDFPLDGFDPGEKLVISFMTVWTLAKLRGLYPNARIVRAMPNGAAPVGASYTPWIGAALAPQDARLAARILSAMGGQDAVQTEGQLDYLAALSGSGSAYPALMAQAMLQDALARGLPKRVAMAAVEAVVCGSAPFLAGKMGMLDDLLNTYRAYKGVTAEGIAAAEGGMRQAIADALAAATAKAKALGQ